ncbi:MAG: NAD-dependent succinate-semialdehyde dehydrogenase [Calditrichia bacterium]
MALQSINPATGETIKTYQEIDAAGIKKVIEKAHEAFGNWRSTSFAERAALMKKAAMVLRDNKEEYAVLMAKEMGKPVADGRSEAEKCAWVCEHYAENAEKFLEPEQVETDATRSYIAFRPLGVIFAIMPWNFPFWQVFRFAAPSLMAGNVGVLKHAPNVPGCSLAIENIFREAGFPEGVFTSILARVDQVDSIIENPLVRAVTLTGSVRAGRVVAKKAGEMIKKTVLELGGSDPYVVLEDADIEAAVSTCVNSRLINSGQSCIAAKRFIMVKSIREQFEKLVVEQMRAQKMGEPLATGTNVGPMARYDLRDNLHRQVRESIEKGARCLLGGELPDLKGAFYPPTVLTDVKKGMPAYEEELFGPVAAIIPVENEQQALKAANDSGYGLGAAVFTSDKDRGERIVSNDLEAGSCFVNAFVKSDPRLPFGGVKESGYGRELGTYGIKEFVNIKTVYIK